MLCLPLAKLSAQTGIGTGGALPNSATAELEVASTDKGVLIPRMTDSEMLLIASPAEGLMVYNLTYKTFYYFSGTWKPAGFSYRTLIRDTDGDTRIEVEKTPDEDIVRFSANADNNGAASGAADEVATLSSTGFNLISENTTYQIEGTQVLRKKNNNTYVGTGGSLTTSGDRNTSFGYGALDKITTGNDNLAVGYNAGLNLTSASNSVLVGDNVASGPALTTGNGNVAIGASTAPVIQGAATNNVVVGYKSGTALTTGKHNILIGYNAGSNITTADSNIVIGINQTVSDPTKNGQCNIGGVIGSDSIYNIKGNVKFANAYTFPDKSSLADYTLVMGSGGNLGWGEKNVAGEANITVTGAATNMQPWSRIFPDGTHDAAGILMVPVTAMANGSISKISTHIHSTSGATTLYMGLYRADGTVANNGVYNFASSMTIAAGTSGVVTIDFYDPGNQSFAVTAGVKYYIAVWDPSNKITFIRNNDPDAQMSKSGGYTPPLATTYPIPFGASDGDVIWVRAH